MATILEERGYGNMSKVHAKCKKFQVLTSCHQLLLLPSSLQQTRFCQCRGKPRVDLQGTWLQAVPSAKWQNSFQVSTGFHWFSGFRELGNLETQKLAHDPKEKIKYWR
jgi:hypothetical protein